MGIDMSIFSKQPIPTLKWQKIKNTGPLSAERAETYRTQVPGGWLLSLTDANGTGRGIGITFVPDPNHEWDGNSLEC